MRQGFPYGYFLRHPVVHSEAQWHRSSSHTAARCCNQMLVIFSLLQLELRIALSVSAPGHHTQQQQQQQQLPAAAAGASTLNCHDVVLDDEGGLLSWIEPQSSSMAVATAAATNFLASNVPPSPLDGSGGRPAYFFYPQLTGPHCAGQSGVLHPTSHMAQPAGLFGMLVDALSLYHAFSGNRTVLDLIPPLLDYMLQNGSTPNLTHWKYPGVPYASSTAGDLYFSGAADMDVYGSLGCGDGYGIIEPDKIGEFGLHLLTAYKLFGTTEYRLAVIHYADVLARNVRDTSTLGAHESPWPFRVNAQNGVVREPYTSAVVMPLRLFDELIQLGWGNIAAYSTVREAVVEWLLRGPLETSWWCAYFEDIGAFGKEMKDQQHDLCAMDRHHPLTLRGGWENTTLKNGSTWFTCNFVC